MSKEDNEQSSKIGLSGFTDNIINTLTNPDEQKKVLKTVEKGRDNGQIGSALAAKSILAAGGIDVDKYEKEIKKKVKDVIPVKTAGQTIDELEKVAINKYKQMYHTLGPESKKY